ncbi:hypothetical protein V1520DRAFT_342027 [Lipomyces starkeyi]|uniref:F-box domain-containing protein n=1 Tax=Lipomyces starkeyi NRRL Y-11557 TaxID=675824 RepID=A0A1E3Q0D1_LIPST|nr:hypothetical protein LIPSTDRAFT_6075 [Lipomyces starkeyi NRRL Y-11557]
MDADLRYTITSSFSPLRPVQFARVEQLDSRDIHSTAVRLPYECLLQIFTYLELEYLGICAQVCRSWNLAASDYHLWQDLDLSGVLPRHLHGSPQTSFCHSQIQKHSKKVVVQNPYYLTESDITALVLTLGRVSACGEQYTSDNDIPQESPLEVLKIENYPKLNCSALSMSLSNDALLTYNIHTLSFHGTHISPSAVGAICSSPSLRVKLTDLDLGFSSLKSDAVYMIADNLENLDRLSLSGNLAVCGDAVEYLLMRLGHMITNLDLRFIWGLEASWFIEYFRTSTHGVKLLDIRGCEHFSKRSIRDMLAVSPDTKVVNSVVLEDDSVEGYRQFVQLLTSASTVDDAEDAPQSVAVDIKKSWNIEQIGGIMERTFGSYESSNSENSSSVSVASEDAEDDFGAFY